MKIVEITIRRAVIGDNYWVSYDTEHTKNMVKDKSMSKDEIIKLLKESL